MTRNAVQTKVLDSALCINPHKSRALLPRPSAMREIRSAVCETNHPIQSRWWRTAKQTHPPCLHSDGAYF
jgi:hypothetical protein